MAEESFGVEEKAFVVDEVNTILRESIETTVQNAAYHHNKVAQWNSNIVELSLKKLTSLNKPFKYIGIFINLIGASYVYYHAEEWSRIACGDVVLLG
jgi:hypothetical protein